MNRMHGMKGFVEPLRALAGEESTPDCVAHPRLSSPSLLRHLLARFFKRSFQPLFHFLIQIAFPLVRCLSPSPHAARLFADSLIRPIVHGIYCSPLPFAHVLHLNQLLFSPKSCSQAVESFSMLLRCYLDVNTLGLFGICTS